ncbi:MAG: 50S ribosomal protein L4 [Candidatus Thermoplasmatota archaeon]|nr:50S ribosomal protein L4 [Candidatus Thermoplasmatota archaeon]
MAENVEKKNVKTDAVKTEAPKEAPVKKAPIKKTPIKKEAAPKAAEQKETVSKTPAKKEAKTVPAKKEPVKKAPAKVETPKAAKTVKSKAPAKKRSPGPKVPLYSMDGKKKGEITLPGFFTAPVRKDLVHRAVVSAEANKRQVYGPSPEAGMRHVAEWPGKGRGMARTPRLNHGGGKGAVAPNTVSGRRAFPPLVTKDYTKKINRKEAKLARMCAAAATASTELVASRGHKFSQDLQLPIVVENKIVEMGSTKTAIAMLSEMGVADDLARAKNGKHVRAGRGKMRGRKYKQPKSILLVIAPGEDGKTAGKAKGFRNLSGVDVVSVKSLGTSHLAPGGDVGRLVLYTEDAIEEMRRWEE